MRSFKKIALIIMSFVIIVSIASVVIIVPYINSDMDEQLDRGYRNSLSGSLDTLIVGSCQGKYAFVPEIIDRKLNCSSYNLCGIHTSPMGEIAILSEEIDRNPVKTVIVDIDYDLLAYTTKGVKAIGDIAVIPRLGTPSKRLSYFFKNVHFEDYPVIYSRYLGKGTEYWVNRILGKSSSKVVKAYKGYRPAQSMDYTIAKENCELLKQSEMLETEIVENNDKKLETLIKMCKDRNINIILIMPPSTDGFVWIKKGWDEVRSSITEIAEKNDVEYIDFNLLKEKSKLLNDSNCYQQEWHLSDNGSRIFTEKICEIISDLNNGKDVSDLFYSSYDEAREHSPYAFSD